MKSRIIGRVLEPAADFLDHPTKQSLGEVQVITEKLIRMLNIDPVGCERSIRKIAEVLGHDHIADRGVGW